MGLPAKVTFTNVNTWSGKLALELECQKYAEEAVAAARAIMNNEKVRAHDRLDAAFGILDRAYGKPMERSVQLSITDSPDTTQYKEMSTRQLLTLAAERLGTGKAVLDQGVTPETVTAEAEPAEGTPGIDFETG